MSSIKIYIEVSGLDTPVKLVISRLLFVSNVIQLVHYYVPNLDKNLYLETLSGMRLNSYSLIGTVYDSHGEKFIAKSIQKSSWVEYLKEKLVKQKTG